MTFLHFAGKCGGLGAMARASSVLPCACANSAGLNNDVSAAAPIPKPACPKKCRRVMSSKRRWSSVMASSLLGNGLVEVEQHVAHHGPGGGFGIAAHFFRFVRVGGEVFLLLGLVFGQVFQVGGLGMAAGDQAVAVFDARAFVGAAFFGQTPRHGAR